MLYSRGSKQSIKFDQIQVRETEVKELEGLMEIIPCAVKVNFYFTLFGHVILIFRSGRNRH